MSSEGFTVHHRLIGRISAWAAFIIVQGYAITSGLGFLSLKSRQDAIGAPFLYIMALLIILMLPFMVITMVAVQAYAPAELKIFGVIALAFMILLAGITSSVNFALLIASYQVDAPWLSLFLPYKWPAVAYAMDIFAWDWFFALSMLFAAPIFRNGRLEKMACMFMIVSGCLCLLGLMLLPFSAMLSINIGILGWGVAGPIVFLILAIVFGRTQPVLGSTQKNRNSQAGA